MVPVQEFAEAAGTKPQLFKIQRMAKDFEELKAQMEKAYPGYKFLDAEVKYNGYNAAFYIYARMVKAGAKGARQRK